MKYIQNINHSFKKQKKIRMQKRKERQMRNKSEKRSQLQEQPVKKSLYSSRNNKNLNLCNNNNCNFNKNTKRIDINTISNTNENLKLHNEINKFVTSILPKRNDIIRREKTIAILTNIINSRFPKWKVKLFGSFTQGTQTYQSDLDFVISKDAKDIISDNDQLQLIFQLLKKNKFGFNMRYIRAKVPIIKAICQSTNIAVDISVNKENGFQAAKIIQKHFKKEPGLKQIIIFIKYLLKSEGLNDASVGGMSSFVLFSLIFYFYQHIQNAQNNPVFIESKLISSEQFDTDDEDTTYHNDKNKIEEMDQSKSNSLNLGKFLFGFLRFYGYKFDDVNCGISLINGGEIFYKNEHTHIIDHESLCIENFQDCQINIGRSCYNYDMIKNFFQTTLSKLQYAQQNKSNSYLKSIHLFLS